MKMMKVIDEVGGSDEGELEDGEIEEEEGQITSNNPDELSVSEVDFVPSTVTQTAKSKSNDSKNAPDDTNRGKDKHSPKLPASHRRKSLPERYKIKETRTTKRTKSTSPKRDERERKQSESLTSSSGKTRAQRRASEALKRASRRRDRDRESPGRRTSRKSSRGRSRSPVIRHQRSYRSLTHEPEVAEYERLLRDHRSIQNRIKEEKRRLSGGSHSNKSTHGSDRGQGSQSKSRGRSKEKSAEKVTKKKRDEDNEDEEMMLLQLRKNALASLAKEEKGKEKTDMGAEVNDEKLKDKDEEGKMSEKRGEIQIEGDSQISVGGNGVFSQQEIQAGSKQIDSSDDNYQAHNTEALEATILPAIGEQETSISDGQYDNYEEVEMEVDDEEEEKENLPKPGIQEAVDNANKEPKGAVVEIIKDEGEAEENQLRAQLLKSLLTKRAAKAQSEKINASTGSTPSKPLSPATPPLSSAPSPLSAAPSPPPSSNQPPRTSTPPPHPSTPPTLSRSSSPVTTRLQQQGSSLAGQVPSRAKPPVAPVHLPVVINLEEDSDESEDESSLLSTSVPFMGQLDSFLKEFRMSSNTQNTKTNNQKTTGKHQARSTSKSVRVPKTPDAMKIASTPTRQEYHRLREEIARRELTRTTASKPQKGRSEKHERKTHKHAVGGRHKELGDEGDDASGRGGSRQPVAGSEMEHGRREMQVTITGHNERQILKSTGMPKADQARGMQEAAAGSGTTKVRLSQGTINPTTRLTSETDFKRTMSSLEAELSRELSAIRELTSTANVTMETHRPSSTGADAGSRMVEENLDIERERRKQEWVAKRRAETEKRIREELKMAEMEKQREELKKAEMERQREELKKAEMERQREELAKMKMERQKQEEEILRRKAEMRKKKLEEIENKRRQVLGWERRRNEYSVLLKKDKGLIMNQEQQITKRRKNISVAKVQLERLREQVAALEKAQGVNQTHMLKHIRQKTALEARLTKNLELDNHARSHLAKLRGVALSEITPSEYRSTLPRSINQVAPSVSGEKRRIEAPDSSSLDIKKARTAGQTADLKKLQDMERHLAEKIRQFREAEAKKALVGVTAKSVIPESKAKLVRQLSGPKPSAKIYTKDVIKLSSEATAPVDSELEEVKVEGSSVKGQERRKSWLDANPTLTPNIKSRSSSKASTPTTPCIAALGKMKAKFKLEGQRSGQSSLTDTSLESDLLQWIESSERTGSPVPVTVNTPKNLPLFGRKALKSGYLSRIRKEQKEAEKKGPDFLSLDFNQRLPSMEATGQECFRVDWCKDTSREQQASVEGVEAVKDEVENASPVQADSHGLVAYRSSLLPFKAFRLSPLFRLKAGYSVQSLSFTNKLDASRPLCLYELKGTCNDDDCVWQHERDYTMSSREMLTDLLSYNAVSSKAQGKDDIAMKNVPASPVRHKQASSEKDKLNACIEKVLGGNDKGVVSRLISCPRKWRPRPRPRSQRLSMGEDDALTEILPLRPPKYPKSSASTVIRKEAIQNAEEEARYFGGGRGEKVVDLGKVRVHDLDLGRLRVHDLEAAVLEKPGNVALWLSLARSLLQEESSVDRALNALSRGLELNCSSAPLWLQYLTVYKERAEREDYVEMCLKATELAPCYSTWWMLLEAEYSVLTKLETCKKILNFLKNSNSTTTTKALRNVEQAESCVTGENKDIECGKNAESSRTLDDIKGLTSSSAVSQSVDRTTNVNVHGETAIVAMETEDNTSAADRTLEREGRASGEENGDEGERKVDVDLRRRASAGEEDGERLDDVKGHVVNREKVSHQVLEILLYQAQLHISIGHKDDAIKDLKSALSIPDQSEDRDAFCSIMMTFDLFLGWLSLMHIHATGSLPSSLYDPAAKLPSKIVKKDLFSISWKVNASDLDKQDVDDLWEGATKACSEGRPPSEQLDSNVVELYNIELEEQLGSGEWVDQLCKLDMGQCRPSKEGEELYCRCIEALHRRDMKPVDVLMHVEMGVSQLPFSCRLRFMEAQLRLLYRIGDPRSSLRECIVNFYQLPVDETSPDDFLLQLYRHQLKLPMPLDFKPPPSSPGAPTQLRDDSKTYMWLCYIMLTLSILGENLACEAFESALVLVQGRKDLELIWIEYIRFVARQTKTTSRDSLPSLTKLVHRCLVSTATRYPRPFDRSGEMWNDFSFHNRVIAVYIEQVGVGERMEEYEKLQLQMPDNVDLAYRACQYAVDNGFSQLGLQIAYSTLHRSPDCIVFWKIVISLALQSQRLKEYIAFVIAHDVDDETKLRDLLQRCQEIGFQQSDVLPGAPIT
ncbi:uncharacterized protein LOC100893615 isoform X2 [Strongylocentrotus purpuratus]|uniref:Putative zinc-finger domain-containing protein n=1 Tax=Strongylocentrotus purpuratus TaxID=7668 RepID=A0A7M7P0L8_STRPU|nr:uncharacterized protein LOC100893615 isoform X2 [Strongylocentrotus purpuratus]